MGPWPWELDVGTGKAERQKRANGMVSLGSVTEGTVTGAEGPGTHAPEESPQGWGPGRRKKGWGHIRDQGSVGQDTSAPAAGHVLGRLNPELSGRCGPEYREPLRLHGDPRTLAGMFTSATGSPSVGPGSLPLSWTGVELASSALALFLPSSAKAHFALVLEKHEQPLPRGSRVFQLTGRSRAVTLNMSSPTPHRGGFTAYLTWGAHPHVASARRSTARDRVPKKVNW